MKISSVFLVFFISSILLLLPVTKPPFQETIFPFQPSEFVLNIQSPTVVVTTNIVGAILLNVSFINQITNSYNLFFSNNVQGDVDIDLTEFGQGFYVFAFLAGEIVVITISEMGIATNSLIILGVMSSVVIILEIRKRLSPELIY